jgi:serine/threonine protein kinase
MNKLCPRKSRQTRIRTNKGKKTTITHPLFDENEIRAWMRQILLGLQNMHQQNYVHRDIKPDVSMIMQNY